MIAKFKPSFPLLAWPLLAGVFLFPPVWATTNKTRLTLFAIDRKWTKSFPKDLVNIKFQGLGEAPRLRDIPSASEIKKLSAESGLMGYTKEWDALDLSVYLIAARTSDARTLAKNYPNVPYRVSSKVKDLLRKMGF